MNVFTFTCSLLLCHLLFVPCVQAAKVENVQLFQEGNRAVFTYDLVGDETSDQVKLTLTVGGQQYASDKLHLSGDVGTVRTGSGKKIVWDVLQNFPRGVGGEMSWVLEGSGMTASSASSQRFSDNGDGTVTDKRTGLVWQQQDDGNKRNWNSASRYCAQLSLSGRNNWRLPSLDELAGIVDESRQNPAIAPIFTGTKSSHYWSSSPSTGFNRFAWFVNFFSGDGLNNYKTDDYYVRCVR